MAKISAVMRNLRRKNLAKSRKASREELKRIIKKDPEMRDDAVLKLQKQKRDASPVRIRNRCRVCGRSKGTLRKFGLCRIHLREAAMRGDVPGLKKASW